MTNQQDLGIFQGGNTRFAMLEFGIPGPTICKNGKDPRDQSWEGTREKDNWEVYSESWYFWDYLWESYYGPYNTKEEAIIARRGLD